MSFIPWQPQVLPVIHILSLSLSLCVILYIYILIIECFSPLVFSSAALNPYDQPACILVIVSFVLQSHKVLLCTHSGSIVLLSHLWFLGFIYLPPPYERCLLTLMLALHSTSRDHFATKEYVFV